MEIKLVEKKNEVNIQELRDQHRKMDKKQLENKGIPPEKAEEILRKEREQNNP